MPEVLPLFPLATVLFPGIQLPLTVFEDRYRELVSTLVGQEDGPGRFGVVAIRQGWEVGRNAVRALHSVGCAAELRRVSRYPDGRFDIVTVGSDRFELLAVDDTSRPYLLGEVQWLPAETAAGDEAERLAGAVGVLFEEYLATAAATQGVRVSRPELPADPVAASYLVASAAVLALDDRQTLLEALNPATRLRTELQLLKREMTMLRRLRALPVPVAELQVAQSLS